MVYSMKNVKKYVSIDINTLSINKSISFELYIPGEKENTMKLFLAEDSVIDSGIINELAKVEKLFINDKQVSKYKCFVKNNISNISKNPNIPVEKKAELVYESAQDTLYEIFLNPDKLADAAQTFEHVTSFVDTIYSSEQSIGSFMKVLEHDYYTNTHSINVSIYALSLATYLNLSKDEIELIGHGALLHDLGKSKIPSEIINKQGKLTDTEFEIMKNHPKLGLEIALKMGIKDKIILSCIYDHHEKANGEGYPRKLTSEKTLIYGKIIAVCDVFDALTTKRSYKDPMSTFTAINLMKNQMSEHIDKELLLSFVKMMKKDLENCCEEK